jgi:hypothetical protein
MKWRIRSDLRQYMNAHRHKANLRLHYWAFFSAFLGWVFIWIDLEITILLAGLHYLFSWLGHFYFERNKPAMFRYPWVGFYIGFLWFFVRNAELLTGKEIIRTWSGEDM